MYEGGGSSRTAAAASQTGPDDLAELNPHETELNPHKAVPVGQPPEQIRRGLSAHGPSPTGTAAGKDRDGDHVACDPQRP